MTNEEKKAIKNVEKFVYSILNGIGANDCKILLNYIEKLEKENEELKDIKQQICNEELINISEYFKLKKENEELKEDREKYKIRLTDEQYNKVINSCIEDINKQWQDKIRTKIKELEKEQKNCFTEKDKKRLAKIEVLNELLGDDINEN